MTRKLIGIGVLLAASAAHAGGFVAPGQSAKSIGRAGAIAASRGPASMYFNPAGLAGVTGVSAEIGVTAVMPSITATGTSPSGAAWTADTQGGVVTPPPVNLYLSAGLRRITLGLAVYVPFGNTLDWGETWEGRFEVSSIKLSAVAFQPTLALQLNDELAIGGGPTFATSTVQYKTLRNFIQTEASVDLGGSATGYGANIGLRYEPMKDKLAFGLSWRSGYDLEFTGNVDFKNVPDSFASRAPDQKVSANISLPDTYTLAGEVAVMDDLLLSAQVDYTLWSVFTEFAVDFENVNTPDLAEPRNWKDAFTFRLGGEYTINEAFKGRLGVYYDQAVGPTNTMSPSSPDADRIGVGLGGAMTMGNATIDAGLMLVNFMTRKSEGSTAFSAEYSGMATVFGVSLSYKM